MYHRNAWSVSSPDDERILQPILPGFYPAPFICRAGDDYDLVTSTFIRLIQRGNDREKLLAEQPLTASPVY